MVNIGAFFAPMSAAILRGDEANPTWSHVFYGAAAVTLVNLIYCMVIFREPERDPAATSSSTWASPRARSPGSKTRSCSRPW